MASSEAGETRTRPSRQGQRYREQSARGTGQAAKAAIAPEGDVYSALNGESSLSGHGHDFDGPSEVALLRCSPSATTSCGHPTLTSFGVSAPPPRCAVSGCYPDFFAATGAIAIDGAGGMAFAYSFSSVTNGPKSLLVSTSSAGLNWTAPTLVNELGDSNVPQIDRGPVSGDFRLAWQDNRTGKFNTWYARSGDGGTTWSTHVRLSNLASGAPYKSAARYTFTDGDYFGIAVSSTGIAHVIWGEADGSSLYCCGDVWYTKRP